MTLFEADARMPDARHMLFVFDGCFSGAEDSRPASYGFAQTTLGLARQVLAAGTLRQPVPAKSILVDLLIQATRRHGP